MESNSRKIISYIAISLDGKIARLNGAVDWLESVPNPDGTDYGYADFLKTIDTTIMGNSTYKEVLGYGIDFPYSDKMNYVMTRNESLTKDENVSYVSENVSDFVPKLIAQTGRDIWLIGGGQLNSLFLKNGWLDEMRIFIMPIVLGEGIPLFSSEIADTHLQLIGTETYASGVIQLIYKPKANE